MEFKKLKVLCLILVVFSLITTSVFAEYCTQEEITKSEDNEIWTDEEGLTCECVLVEEADAQGNAVEKYEKVCASQEDNNQEYENEVDENQEEDENEVDEEQISDVEEEIDEGYDTNTSSIQSENQCRDRIKKINEEIREEVNKVKDVFFNLKDKDKKLRLKVIDDLREYKRCIIDYRVKKYKTDTTTASITGHMSYGNISTQVDKIKSKIQSISDRSAQVAVSSTDISIPPIENELSNLTNVFDNISDNIINDWKTQISDIQDDDLNICNQELEDLKESIEDYKEYIEEVNDFREKHKEVIENIKELINKRNKIFRECFKISKNISDCKVPKELYEQEKKILEDIKDLKEDMNLDQNNVDSKYSEEYRKLYRKLLDIRKKIQVTKNSCNKTSNILSNVKTMCQEKKDIIDKIMDLKERIIETKDKKEIILYKRKLEYLQDQLDEVVCVDLDQAKTTADIKAEKKMNIASKEKFEKCVEKLKSSDIGKDIARKACLMKYNLQVNKYQEKVKQLENKIKEQRKVIQNLNQKVRKIRNKFKGNLNQKEKQEIFKENKDDIKEHTMAVIDRIISSREKLIEEIEESDMDKDRKDYAIDRLNEIISEFEYIKEEIELTDDASELKELVKEAREKDILYKRETFVLNMRYKGGKLLDIIDQYYKDIPEYKQKVKPLEEEFKEAVREASANIKDLTNKDIKEQDNIYHKLKRRLKILANLENSSEVSKQ